MDIMNVNEAQSVSLYIVFYTNYLRSDFTYFVVKVMKKSLYS